MTEAVIFMYTKVLDSWQTSFCCEDKRSPRFCCLKLLLDFLTLQNQPARFSYSSRISQPCARCEQLKDDLRLVQILKELWPFE